MKLQRATLLVVVAILCLTTPAVTDDVDQCFPEAKKTVIYLESVDTEGLANANFGQASKELMKLNASLLASVSASACAKANRAKFYTFLARNLDGKYANCILSAYDYLITLPLKQEAVPRSAAQKLDTQNTALELIDKVKNTCKGFQTE